MNRPTHPPKADKTANLFTLSADYGVPVTKLEGLFRHGHIFPVSAGENGLEFDRARVLSVLRACGDVE